VRSESGAVFPSSSISGSLKMGRVELVKKDWLRFITFVKLCLVELL
jgi:hypothetical protein